MGQHIGRTRQQDGKKTGQDRRQGGRVGVGQHGGHERRQHEGGGGCGKEDRCPEAVGVSLGFRHNETAEVVGAAMIAVTNLVQWTSNGVSRVCDYLRMWCVYLVMMVSTDVIGCGGFGGVRVRVRVASRPSQKPGLSSRPGKNNFLHAPTITQPPQWKQMVGSVTRWAAGGQGAPSQVACARRQAQVEYFQLAGRASRHRAKLSVYA